MQALFDQYGSVDETQGPSQAKLLADRDTVNEVLACDDGHRRICREAPPETAGRLCRRAFAFQFEVDAANDATDARPCLVTTGTRIRRHVYGMDSEMRVARPHG